MKKMLEVFAPFPTPFCVTKLVHVNTTYTMKVTTFIFNELSRKLSSDCKKKKDSLEHRVHS